MIQLLRLYRTTTGLITAMSAFVLVAVGLSLAWPVAVAGPAVFMAPLAVFALVFGCAGLYMFSDAVERVYEALLERYGDVINEVMSA